MAPVARRTAIDSPGAGPGAQPSNDCDILGLETAEGRVEDRPAGNDDDVVPWRRRVAAEQLANEPPRPVPFNRDSELARGRDAQPGRFVVAPIEREDYQEAALMLPAALVDQLELAALADGLVSAKPLIVHDQPAAAPQNRASRRACGPGMRRQFEETVRRLRPLARRRLSTRRPFFVDIRTRNPCVRRRRRLFG